jgi:hypothetical protein
LNLSEFGAGVADAFMAVGRILGVEGGGTVKHIGVRAHPGGVPGADIASEYCSVGEHLRHVVHGCRIPRGERLGTYLYYVWALSNIEPTSVPLIPITPHPHSHAFHSGSFLRKTQDKTAVFKLCENRVAERADDGSKSSAGLTLDMSSLGKRSRVCNIVLFMLVTLTLVLRGNLVATKLFNTLLYSVPVDCVTVKRAPNFQVNATNVDTESDLCSFAQQTRVLIQFVRGGEYGESAARELLTSISPNATVESYDARKHAKPDLIVEGPPKFSKLSNCALDVHVPWLQVTAEPGRYYSDDDWCSHATAPIARLDTSFHHFCRVNQSTTVFIWVPYAKVAMTELLFNPKDQLSFDWKRWRERPYFLAWVASNCKVKKRQIAYRSIHKHASKHGFGEVHALGTCARNKASDIKPRSDGWRSVTDVYENYRFVLAMESQLEQGYVTEKIVTAFSAGAIPIYYGDSAAAALLFGKFNVPYIDVRYVWRRFTERSVNIEQPKASDWFIIAQYMHEFEKKPGVYSETMRAHLAQDASQIEYEAYSLAAATSSCNS